MSYAIGRSFRLMRRWTSYRPSLCVPMRRDRLIDLRGDAAHRVGQSSSEIALFLRRYGRDGVATSLLRASPVSTDHFVLHAFETSTDEPSPWNIANAVTVGRIVVTPLIGAWIISGQYKLAFGGLVYAALSDALDGFLARRLNIRTIVGSYLDPAADKLLISTTSACLAYKGVIPVELVALMMGRDLGLVGGWLWLVRNRKLTTENSKGIPIPQIEPLLISKLNTALQIALAFSGVTHAADLSIVTEEMLRSIAYATAATTTASGISYANKFRRMQLG